uniref:RNase H type-1 domain-containing protein n=1 Tax=Cannabis sativa TaxID=3483 RepID=A0A803NN59_CANSA
MLNKKSEASPKRKGGPRFVNFTELSAPRDHIYAIEEQNGVFRKPPPIQGNHDKRDPKKFCKYHKDIGHTTLECWFLQDENEELIRRGKFSQYKKNGENHPRADHNNDTNDVSGFQAPRDILTIIGGPHVSGETRKAQERYAKEAKEKPLTNVNNLSERPKKLFKKECEDITFLENDTRLVHHPHADALVVIANIGGDNCEEYNRSATKWTLRVHTPHLDQRPRSCRFIVKYNETEANANVPDLDTTAWKVYVDGASNENRSGAKVAMISLDRMRLQATLRFTFLASNNEVEYALLAGLRLAKVVGANKVEVYKDIQLVVNQVLGKYQTHGEKMAAYVSTAKALLQELLLKISCPSSPPVMQVTNSVSFARGHNIE